MGCFPLPGLTRKRARLPRRCPVARGGRTSSRRTRSSKKTRSGRIAARAGYGQKPAARDCAAANGSSTTHDKSPARRCTPSAHQMPVSRRPAGHFSRGVKVRIMAPFARKTESKGKPTCIGSGYGHRGVGLAGGRPATPHWRRSSPRGHWIRSGGPCPSSLSRPFGGAVPDTTPADRPSRRLRPSTCSIGPAASYKGPNRRPGPGRPRQEPVTVTRQ